VFLEKMGDKMAGITLGNVVLSEAAGGVLFTQTVEGVVLVCLVPAAEWWSAWNILKQVKMESDVRQWSYIDEDRTSMVLCESFVVHEKNVYQVKFACRVAKLLHTKEFKDVRTFSENKGKH